MDEAALVALVRQLDPQGRLIRAWPLTGGISAQVTAVEWRTASGAVARAVVRQHGERDRQRNPAIAQDEFRLLQVLDQAGIAVPRPLYVDPNATLFATPALVVSYLDGVTEVAPADLPSALAQAAAQLAALHRLPAPHPALSFLPQQGAGFGPRPPQLDDRLAEGTIRAWLEGAGPLAPQNPSTILHGDYWPGNWLWQAGHLVGVIDWEDAAVGDPLADLANSRLEVLWAFGEAAMESFTTAYLAHHPLDLTHLTYWDLCAALRPAGKLSTWGLDPAVEATMRTRHHWFVQQAIGQASCQGTHLPL